jgi:hypothetical protein
LPRVVRLGRAANDNARRPNLRTRILLVSFAVVLSAVAAASWLL